MRKIERLAPARNAEIARGAIRNPSTQCDLRTPEKARFPAAAGFSQRVLARKLSLSRIIRMRAAPMAPPHDVERLTWAFASRLCEMLGRISPQILSGA
jgi:hypothetical protein